MNDSYGSFSRTRDRITIPTVWVAFALSVLLHLAGLFGWVPKVPLPFDEAKLGKKDGTLAIRLVPPASPPTSAPASPPRAAARPRVVRPPVTPAPAARAVPTPRPTPPAPAPPVLAIERPTPPEVSTPQAPPRMQSPPGPATASPPPAAGDDLASYIASRRKAREGPAAPPSKPAETEQEKHNRVVAENLGLTNTPTFGNDPDRGGGVFQIRSMGYDIGEFAFFGWNKDINRNSLQVIEVRRGNNENMEIAIARKMISIIRERSKEDFLWQSKRLNKGLWLSARPADTAELEAFILKELFPDPKPR
jgi:hypothetical protein